jgi:hypothetical protein
MRSPTVVDTNARRQAAKLLLDFYKGRITNDQLEDAWPVQSSDRGLHVVYGAAWGLYDDFYEHYADPKIRRHYAVSKEIHKCLLFLESDKPYEWVTGGPGTPFSHLLEFLSPEVKRVNRNGQLKYWPFYRCEDYVGAYRKKQLRTGN